MLLLVPTGRSDNEFERYGAGDIVKIGWFNDCEERVITLV